HQRLRDERECVDRGGERIGHPGRRIADDIVSGRVQDPRVARSMSNKTQLRVRKVAASDPRIARTTHALGRALVDLIQEHNFDEITVQQILDRAGVGRTAFYAHYRNKEDVLHSSYE